MLNGIVPNAINVQRPKSVGGRITSSSSIHACPLSPFEAVLHTQREPASD